MLTSKTLLSPLSAILAKVHYPPPIDKRESQRLLQALTVSFRTHLDREHGFIAQDSPPATTTYTQPSSSTPPATAADADRHPTDRHVRAILSNPLFSYTPAKPAPSPTHLAPSDRDPDRDPMDVFDQAVAKGLMTPQRATGVLIAKRQAIAQSASLSVNEGMAASGTGHRVFSWLRSSGLERRMDFVEHQALLTQLIPFMVEEGLDEIVWTWVDRWMKSLAEGSGTRATASFSPLLTALVRAKVSPGTTLDSAYATMVRARETYSDQPGFGLLALSPWRTLSMLSTVFAWQRNPPTEKLFDSFASMSERLRAIRNFKLIGLIRLDRAHLDLYHPTHPDATAAMEFLKSSMLDRLSKTVNNSILSTISTQTPQWDPVLRPHFVSDNTKTRSTAKKMILLGTDTAQHLTRTGNEAEADWVGNMLLEKFGQFMREELVTASPDLHRLDHSMAF